MNGKGNDIQLGIVNDFPERIECGRGIGARRGMSYRIRRAQASGSDGGGRLSGATEAEDEGVHVSEPLAFASLVHLCEIECEPSGTEFGVGIEIVRDSCGGLRDRLERSTQFELGHGGLGARFLPIDPVRYVSTKSRTGFHATRGRRYLS